MVENSCWKDQGNAGVKESRSEGLWEVAMWGMLENVGVIFWDLRQKLE